MKKWIGLGLAASLLSFTLTGFSLAATEERTPISTYSLDISSEIVPGDTSSNVSVTCDGNGYSIDEVTVTNEPSDMWKNNDKPKVRITLVAENGYYFAESGKEAFSLSGDTATLGARSITSNKGILNVTVTLEKLSGGDVSISGLSWGAGGIANWDYNDLAKHYQVRIRRGNTTITTVSTSDNSYNFAKYFTRSGTYSFYVRAADYGSKYGDWASSDDWYVTSREAYDIYLTRPSEPGGTSTTSSGYTSSSSGPGATASGGWCKDNVGWWFRHSNGSYTTNNWEKIDGYWYYFGNNGYMHTGWLLWNNYWYYLDTTSGAMLTNATTPDGYYVNSDGIWTGRKSS